MSRGWEILSRQYRNFDDFLQADLGGDFEAFLSSRLMSADRLANLSGSQFFELCTDVGDELGRRNREGFEAPGSLAPRDDFHTRRNQARQKLGSLSPERFRNLVVDVFLELERRYPNIKSSSPLPVQQQAALQPPGGSTQQAYQSAQNLANAFPSVPVQKPRRRPAGPISGNTSMSSMYSNNRNGFSSNGYQPHLLGVNGDRYGMARAPVPGSKHVSNGSVMERPRGTRSHSSWKSTESLASLPISPSFSADDALYTNYGPRAESIDGAITDDEDGQLRRQTEILRIRSSYESKLTTMRKRMIELEAQLSRGEIHGDRMPTSQSEDLKLVALEKDKEIERLKHALQETRLELSRLRQELADLKLLYQEKANEVQKMKSRSVFALDDPMGPLSSENTSILHPDGAIERTRVAAFRKSIEELLLASRSDTPASVMEAMRSIVMVCKLITGDVEQFELSDGSTSYVELSPADFDVLLELKPRLSSNLADLMQATRDYADSQGLSPVALVEAAASRLTSTVVELVNLLKLRAPPAGGAMSVSVGSRSALSLRSASPHSAVSSPHPYPVEEDDRNHNMEHLKDFLEEKTDIIVAAIQDLLAMMRTASCAAELTDKMTTVVSTVDQIVKVSRRTFAQLNHISTIRLSANSLHSSSAQNSTWTNPAYFRKHGDPILDRLDETRASLSELLSLAMSNGSLADGNDDTAEESAKRSEYKAFKQSIAAAAFEIAKQTRELVTFLES